MTTSTSSASTTSVGSTSASSTSSPDPAAASVAVAAAFEAVFLVAVFLAAVFFAGAAAAAEASPAVVAFLTAAFLAGAAADAAAVFLAAGSVPSAVTAPFLTEAVFVAAAAFFVVADVVRRVEDVAATAREAVAGSRVTVMPCSSRERSTAFMRFGGTSAPTRAVRSCSLSTDPWVLPSRTSSCRAGWENSCGSGRVGLSEAFWDTGDTDYLSSRTRSAHAVADAGGHVFNNNNGGGSIHGTGPGVCWPVLVDDIVKTTGPRNPHRRPKRTAQKPGRAAWGLARGSEWDQAPALTASTGHEASSRMRWAFEPRMSLPTGVRRRSR